MALTARRALLGLLVGALAMGCEGDSEAHVAKSEESLKAISLLSGNLEDEINDLDLLITKIQDDIDDLNNRRGKLEVSAWSPSDSTRRTQLENALAEVVERKQAKAEPGPEGEPRPEGEPGPEAGPEGDAVQPPVEDLRLRTDLQTVAQNIVAFHDEKFPQQTFHDRNIADSYLYQSWAVELKLDAVDTAWENEGSDDAYSPYDGYDQPDAMMARAKRDCRRSDDAYRDRPRSGACQDVLAGITAGQFEAYKNHELQNIDNRLVEYKAAKVRFSEAREKRLVQQQKLLESYGSAFDGMLSWAVPVVAGAVLLIFIFGYSPRRNKDRGSAPSDDIIAIITVLLLVSLILILALANKLESEALGTLIGGISAYVLGDTVRRRKDKDAEPAPESRPGPGVDGK